MKSDESPVSELFKRHRSELRRPIPLGLERKILSKLPETGTERRSFFAWMSFGSGAVAACLALVMAFQLGRLSNGGPGGPTTTEEVVASHVRSLMVQHLSDVVSTDQHTVKPWFEGKIDFGPSVKDFASAGFPLIGGRLDYVDGQPTAALIYRFNQHVINVFQHPAAMTENSNPRLQTLRGYQVFDWSKDGMRYWVVSDVNAADLQRFVELWR